MTDILKIDVKDENLRQIFNKNPFYINIKGSINICQIRCGQTFQNNNVNIASMTNVGKVLILNPNINEKVSASIKLAFDTSNTNVDDEGNSQYEFKNIFFTTPSFHRINGELSDFESYIVYASTQENGNTLFSVICTLYNGVSNIPTDSHELLTYKLFDELFLNNNTIPEKFGTKPIESPQNIDISELMPEKGKQSFYEYVNPNNPNVNIRIYQEKLNISNNALEKLKKALTPGAINNDLKLTISQQINPNDGLFFFFSKDLTNNYKNFMNKNIKNNDSKKENFEDLKKNNIEEEIEDDDDDDDILSELENDQTIDEKETFKSDNIKLQDLRQNKIFEINSNNGSIINIFNSLEDLISKNENYDEDDILDAVNQFPNKIYKNSLWRVKYHLIIKKKENEIKKISIDEVRSYINKENKNNKVNNKDVFQSLKKNKKLNKYEISFEYTIDKNISTFDNILTSVALWVVLLILFIFYQIIYYILNINYQKINLDDNDILVEEGMKKMAVYRTWINLIFIFQIICISTFSLISISGGNMSNIGVNTFIIIFSLLFILPLFIFIYKYSDLRLQYSNSYISYVESISLPLFLNDLKDKDWMITFKNFWSFISSVFYPDSSKEQCGGYESGTSPLTNLLTNQGEEPLLFTNKQNNQGEEPLIGKPYYPNSNIANNNINIFDKQQITFSKILNEHFYKIISLSLGFLSFLIILFCIFLKIDINNKGVFLFVVLSSIFACLPLYILYNKYFSNTNNGEKSLIETKLQKNQGEESLLFTNEQNDQGEESLLFTNEQNNQGEESLLFTNEQKNQDEESLLFTNDKGGLLEILNEINKKLNTLGGRVQNAGIKKKELRNYIEILKQFENSGLLNEKEKSNINQLLKTLNENIINNKK